VLVAFHPYIPQMTRHIFHNTDRRKRVPAAYMHDQNAILAFPFSLAACE
jgi:hypothetical protein